MNKEIQDNMAFFDMCSAEDLYNKLKYDYEILNKNRTPYNYMNYIFTARHLEDWILKDKNKEMKQRCRKVLNIKVNQEWSSIVSLCNRGKHFRITEYHKKKIKNIGLFDFGNIDFSDFSFRTSSYEVQVGNVMKDLDCVCSKIMNDYKIIFEE